MCMYPVLLKKLKNSRKRKIHIAHHPTPNAVYAFILSQACWKSPKRARVHVCYYKNITKQVQFRVQHHKLRSIRNSCLRQPHPGFKELHLLLQFWLLTEIYYSKNLWTKSMELFIYKGKVNENPWQNVRMGFFPKTNILEFTIFHYTPWKRSISQYCYLCKTPL